MEKRAAILEISNTEIRVALGNVIDGQPVVVYRTERPVTGLLSRGEILDEEGLIKALQATKTIEDEEAHVRYNLTDVTLVIPPLGLEIYEAEKTTNVVSPTSIIERIDIENVISLVQKESVEAGKEIVDILPDFFVYGDQQYSIEPPVGKTSNELTVHAKVHVMQKRYIDSYRHICEAVGINVRRVVTSPYAITRYVRHMKEMPKDYLLVEMGAQLTNLTLVGNHVPFCTANIFLGGNDLSLAISEKFEISEQEATTIKEMYGFNQHELAFNPVVSSHESVEGGLVEYTQDDLNHVIDLFFRDHYFKEIKNAIQAMLKDYPADVQRLPIMFAGGLAKLKSFEHLAKEDFKDQQALIILRSSVIGLRHPRYLGMIGALEFALTYKGSLSDQRLRVQQIGRVKQQNSR